MKAQVAFESKKASPLSSSWEGEAQVFFCAETEKQMAPAMPMLGYKVGLVMAAGHGTTLKEPPGAVCTSLLPDATVFDLTPSAASLDDGDLVRFHKNNCSSGFAWGLKGSEMTEVFWHLSAFVFKD
jgi:hypothetical protein